MKTYDVIVIGGGIIGLATARELLQKHPGLRLALLEKEGDVGQHQTGHNSGVIHSGIYYKPGSKKALLCKLGKERLISYCKDRGIAVKKVGKVILATVAGEIPRLNELYQRGVANGAPSLRLISEETLKDIEPHAKACLALHSPETGIIDFKEVARHFLEDVRASSGEVFFNERVLSLSQDGDIVKVHTKANAFQTKKVINTAGFYADHVAHMADSSISNKQIIPFRGEYYTINENKKHLVKGLIYPVPNPEFPFLGVHLSQTIDGRVEAGPNAVLALAREGYSWRDFNWKDTLSILSYLGFWRMAKKYYKVGLYEVYRSFSKRAFLKSLQALVPELKEEDLSPGPSGVRSQVVHRTGKLEDDFLIHKRSHSIHVLNAPSPAATASLAIGEVVAKEMR